jgi:hypothetical protein
MARALSTTAIKAMMSARTEEVFLTLLKLDHADWASPVYLVNDTQQLTSGGNIHNPFPFNIIFPSESKENPNAKCTLEIDATDRSIIELIRSAPYDMTCAVSLIIASEPDTILVGPMEYKLAGWSVPDGGTVAKTTLESANILSERIGGHTFNPSEYPGCF